jgi:hypothetical protein
MNTITINVGFIAVLIIIGLIIYLYWLIKCYKYINDNTSLIVHAIFSAFWITLLFLFFYHFKFTVTLIN